MTASQTGSHKSVITNVLNLVGSYVLIRRGSTYNNQNSPYKSKNLHN